MVALVVREGVVFIPRSPVILHVIPPILRTFPITSPGYVPPLPVTSASVSSFRTPALKDGLKFSITHLCPFMSTFSPISVESADFFQDNFAWVCEISLLSSAATMSPTAIGSSDKILSSPCDSSGGSNAEICDVSGTKIV